MSDLGIGGLSTQGENALDEAHRNGLSFVGGSRLDFGGALATDRYIAAIRNPVTSGRTAFIYAVALYTSVTQWFRWAKNPTLDSPTISASARSLNLANPGVSVMEMMTDTTVPTAADFWTAETRVTANAPVPLRFANPIPLAPGDTFAIVGDSSAAQQTCANVYYFER